MRAGPRIGHFLEEKKNTKDWRWWHKCALLYGSFYWYVFHGGLWATVLICPFFGMPAREGVTQVLPIPIELTLIFLIFSIPWYWPEWVVLPILVGTIASQNVVRGSIWWEGFWQAHNSNEAIGPENTYWLWSEYSLFFIYGPILAIILVSWLSLRQIHFWIRHRKIG